MPALAVMTEERSQPKAAGRAFGFDLKLDSALIGQFCDLAALGESSAPWDSVHLFTIRRIPAT